MSAVWCDEPEGGGSKGHFSNSSAPDFEGRAGRQGQWGANGADLVEITGSDVVGHRGRERAGRGALPRSICRDVVFQSFHDRISAHGRSLQRGLRFLPYKWALQRHADTMLRLPQWRQRARKIAGTSKDDEFLRGLSPDVGMAKPAFYRPRAGDRAVRRLPQRHDCTRQAGQSCRYRRALRWLPQEYGQLWRRDYLQPRRYRDGLRQLP